LECDYERKKRDINVCKLIIDYFNRGPHLHSD